VELGYQLAQEKGNLQQVDFELKVLEGPVPESITWTWGDGTTKKTTGLTVSHDFARSFGSVGASYQVSAMATGPDICEVTASKEIIIPAIPCPSIVKITHQEKVSDIDVAASFTLEVSGVTPAYYEWTWGDGTANITTDQLTITHAYAREGGKEHTYTARVRLVGPGSCESSAQTEIVIPGICPRVTGVQYVLADVVGNKQKANFTISTDFATPDSFIWHWGDGSAPETTATNQVSHAFVRETGKDTQYQVRVVAQGPGTCEADGTVSVTIGSVPCPQLSAMTAQITETRETSVSVTAKATVTGGNPEKYLWNWGDGTTAETTAPTATHSYPRKASIQATQVSVTANGPGTCESKAQAQVSIPATELPPQVPLLCRLMNWIVAYLVSVTTGVLLVLYVDNSCDAETNGGLAILSGILVVLSVGAIALWMVFRNRLCPPKACDWYAVGWTAMFTMTATAFYTMGCCGPNSWVSGLVFLILGGLFAYLWFTKCAVNSRALHFLLYVGIFVIASLISLFLVGNSFLACL
jgi:hypothetical protein